MVQMKEQIKSPEKELNKIEISNCDTELKTLVVRMLKELSEDFNGIKKIQSESKSQTKGVNNSLKLYWAVDFLYCAWMEINLSC